MVSATSQPAQAPARGKRADALRNQQTLLAAAAEVFVTSGVDAPIREIAARAGVGIGTIYRHFPTRADLVVAVYRHQVEACAEAGPALLARVGSPLTALRQWVGLFVHQARTREGAAIGQQRLRRAAHLFPRPPSARLRAIARRRGRRWRDQARYARLRIDARHRQPVHRP